MITTDQRGKGRLPDGDQDEAAICGIGAYEVNLIAATQYLPYLKE